MEAEIQMLNGWVNLKRTEAINNRKKAKKLARKKAYTKACKIIYCLLSIVNRLLFESVLQGSLRNLIA